CVRRAKNSADGGTDGGPETGPDAGPLSCETDPPDPCFTCRCEECDTEFSDCLNDAGCIDILDCAGTAACILLPVTGAPSDPNDCYQSTQCQDVIDGTGGPEGASYQAILDLLDCAAYADCPACDSD